MVTEEQITNKVKAVMNEIGAEKGTNLLSEDTLKIEDYIVSCIPEAVALCVQKSKGRCVNPKSSAGVAVTNNGDGTGYIVLPEDFLSLVAFKMEGWRRIVSQAYSLDSEVYRQQSNPVTRAGSCKPVCILSRTADGKKSLEYYSVKSAEPRVTMFVYEAKYNKTEGLRIEENDPLFGAVAYFCASLVYSIFENPATAAEMQTIATNLIENGIPHQ